MTPIAANGTSSQLFYKKKSENGDASRNQNDIPVAVKDTTDNGAVCQIGDVTRKTSSPLSSGKKTENGVVNGHHKVVSVAEMAVVEAVVVQQDAAEATEAKKAGPPTLKKRERETQIKSLHIDDDEDVIEERKLVFEESASEGQMSGAEMFASSRPHAWHHDLAKKNRRAAGEPPLDRQVCLSVCLRQACR